MALTVETGSGNAAADSYNSLQGIAALLAERGLTLPAGPDAANEGAAREATVYLDHFSYRGAIRGNNQALAWPRIDVVDREGREIRSNVVPPAILRAHAFLTYQARLAALRPVLTGAPITSETVGPIKTDYGEGGSTPERTFPEVEMILRNLLASSTSSVLSVARLVRA